MSEANYDVIVVGAGAAGLMATIFAARQDVNGRRARVLLLDGQTKIGAKILVSGGGRCNVTNDVVNVERFHSESDAEAQNKSVVARVLRAFNVEATHRFFAEIGVDLKLEPTGKYFPVSDSARTVLNALLREVENSGALLKTGSRVTKIEQNLSPCDALDQQALESPLWRVRAAGEELTARSLILCTGGLALPKSGSDGAGFEFARQVGHSIVNTTPALTPLLANPARHAELSGIALPVRLVLREDKTLLASYTGSFLFTHVGYSGPVALNLSRHFARERTAHPQARAFLRFLPDVEDRQEARFWHEWVGREAKKMLIKALSAHFPERVAQMLLREAKVPGDKALGKLSPDEARRVQSALFDLPLPVVEVAPYYKAEATAGGVALGEIEAATMMSRKAPGLFFAGEVCDVDGWLGGYNFQWAWSSGAVAGRNAARFALRQ